MKLIAMEMKVTQRHEKEWMDEGTVLCWIVCHLSKCLMRKLILFIVFEYYFFLNSLIPILGCFYSFYLLTFFSTAAINMSKRHWKQTQLIS